MKISLLFSTTLLFFASSTKACPRSIAEENKGFIKQIEEKSWNYNSSLPEQLYNEAKHFMQIKNYQCANDDLQLLGFISKHYKHGQNFFDKQTLQWLDLITLAGAKRPLRLADKQTNLLFQLLDLPCAHFFLGIFLPVMVMLTLAENILTPNEAFILPTLFAIIGLIAQPLRPIGALFFAPQNRAARNQWLEKTLAANDLTVKLF